jgi:hypothetical protein
MNSGFGQLNLPFLPPDHFVPSAGGQRLLCPP